MKNWIPLIAALGAFNANANIVITEYVEGGGHNKAIEISNLGSQAVKLQQAGFKLKLYANGATEPTTEAELSGELPPNASFVVYNPNATDPFKKEHPAGLAHNVINFNGDDVIVLENAQGVVDRFGQVGVRQQWQDDNGFNSKDKTLRRLASISIGNTDAMGDFAPVMSEWQAFDKDTSDGLGCVGVDACTGNEPQPLPEGGDATPGVVIISEYIEGGGFNKVIEISNIGGSDVDLAAEGYKLQLFANGATEATGETLLQGLLVPNSSIVAYNNNANDEFKKAAPQGINASQAVNFNGDDAVVLLNDQGIVDSFGQVGVRQQWSNGDGFNSKDKTLRRRESVTQGDTIADDDFASQTTDWATFDKDTSDGVGCYGEAACTGDEPLPGVGTEIGGGGDGGGTDPGDQICTNCPELNKILDRANYDANAYYSNAYAANADDLTALRAAINTDISANFKQLTYSEAWTALTHTDEDPANDKNVILIYSGRSIPKAENGSGADSSNQDYWNREHVWAKSHGFPSSSQFGYTDIHHLRPADVSMNTQRSDNDFDNGGEPVAEAPENLKNAGLTWEPRNAVKGDVARMVFYMDIRYEEGSDGSMPDLKLVDRIDTDRTNESDGYGELGKLCTLYQWHLDDPVDEFELNRNHTIYEFQGNRNPFIDHPEWVETLHQASCVEQPVEQLSVTITGASDVDEGTAVTLTADTSNEGVSFAWQQISGPAVSASSMTEQTLNFNAPSVDADTALSFKVTITKADLTAEHEVSFTVKNKPEVTPEPEPKKSGSSSLWLSLIGLFGLSLVRRRV